MVLCLKMRWDWYNKANALQGNSRERTPLFVFVVRVRSARSYLLLRRTPIAYRLPFR